VCLLSNKTKGRLAGPWPLPSLWLILYIIPKDYGSNLSVRAFFFFFLIFREAWETSMILLGMKESRVHVVIEDTKKQYTSSVWCQISANTSFLGTITTVRFNLW
jgi:hypothetical protein